MMKKFFSYILAVFLLLPFSVIAQSNAQSNKAFHKETKQSSIAWDGESNRAVDGNIHSSNETTNNSSTKNWLIPFGDLSCSQYLEIAFDCSCFFSIGETYKGPVILASDMVQNACVNINDPQKSGMNALYPDWEEQDYKAEMKKLVDSNSWISVSGDEVRFFGKSLSTYKYEDATEFLIDVILASGKDITAIPITTTTGGATFDGIHAQAKKAIILAKEYKSKGGDDPLTIVKYNNPTYDVFVRYRQITQYEDEANLLEGTITLLKHRSEEILDTKNVKANCGC